MVKTSKNELKQCVICSNRRYLNTKLCKQCDDIKKFIREYGIRCIIVFMDYYKTEVKTIEYKPSAPYYTPNAPR